MVAAAVVAAGAGGGGGGMRLDGQDRRSDMQVSAEKDR